MQMHINAIKESRGFGGAHTYTCPLGIILWISPVYLNERFMGALMGGSFSHGEQCSMKASAELLRLCAQSLSIGSEDCHKTIERRSLQRSELILRIEELKKQNPQDNKALEYPSGKERKMLEALRRGNISLARELLNEILAFVLLVNNDDFNHVKCRAIELSFLFARAGLSTIFTVKTLLKNNRRNLLAIEKAKNIEQLTDVLYRIMDDLGDQMHSFHKTHHASALKKAEDYILENLSRKLSLKGIAKASGFSAPYFSKIFKDAMGENLTSYLNRLRVEKAAALLSNSELSLFGIAKICGFTDQSWFSKTFKYYTGKSPGKFRSQYGKHDK